MSKKYSVSILFIVKKCSFIIEMGMCEKNNLFEFILIFLIY